MIFSQRQPEWAGIRLGNSDVNTGGFGCVATDLAQALNLAGYKDIDPGVVVNALNKNGGFTKDGLLIWAVAERCFPQFHYNAHDDSKYNVTFVQGLWGRFNHWVLQSGTGFSDPYYGVNAIPAGFKPTGTKRIASIDPAPTPEPTPEFPKTVEVIYEGNTNVRTQPNTQSSIVPQPTDSGFLNKGNTFTAVALVDGEDPYGQGNSRWYQSAKGNFVYSGACN